MPGKFSLKVDGPTAEKLLSQVTHSAFRKGFDKNWCVLKTAEVPAHSICWLFCWAKTGMNSEDTAKQIERIFNQIFDPGYTWLDSHIDHGTARRLRYSRSGKAEGQFAQAISN